MEYSYRKHLIFSIKVVSLWVLNKQIKYGLFEQHGK